MPNPIKVRTIAEARRVIASLEAQVADLDKRIAESESVRHQAETEEAHEAAMWEFSSAVGAFLSELGAPGRPWGVDDVLEAIEQLQWVVALARSRGKVPA